MTEATISVLSVTPQTGELEFVNEFGDGEGFVDEPSQMARNTAGSLLFTGDFNTDKAPTMGIFQASASGSLTSLGTFPLGAGAAATSIAAATF